MAYPIEQLPPQSSQADMQSALMATVQQLIQEGKTPEEAQQMAMDMLQQMQQPTGTRSSAGPTRTTLRGFASDGAMGQGSGQDYGVTVRGQNRSYTNFRPLNMPPGPGSNQTYYQG